jgi:hydroxymethylpyrimidine/phosphomethylpyrimidine kinase
MKSVHPPPILVVVGGLDPGGGAGLLRDVATATARGARVHAVGTAWTEQGTVVHRVEPREPGHLTAAVRYAVAEIDRIGRNRAVSRAIKIGMVPGAAAARAILDGLAGYDGPLVVDPVLASSRGGVLFEGTATDMLPLLQRATLVTPNAPEVAWLTGLTVRDAGEAEAAGQSLRAAGVSAVLVKGGHIEQDREQVTDLLVTPAETVRLRHPRIAGPSPRGTGCALATAIAVELALGGALEPAVRVATAWLAGAIAAATDVAGERRLPDGGASSI